MPENLIDDEDAALDEVFDRLPDDQGSQAFKELRTRYRERGRELKELRPFKQIAEEAQRTKAFTDAGLPTDLSATKRTALLAAAGPEADAEGIKAAAIELGFIAIDAASQPRAAAAADSQIAAQTQGSAGHVPTLPTLDQQIKAAEDARDWKTASRLKLGKLVPAQNGLIPA